MSSARLPSLCHVLYGFGMGGAEHQLAQVINATTGEFRHSVASLNGDTACRAHLDDASAVRFPELPAGRGRHDYFLQLAGWLRRERPDLVLSYGWAGVDAILAARVTGIAPVVHAEHGLGEPELDGQFARRLWMRRAFYRSIRKLVVPSDTMYRIARESWWLPERRIRLLPSSIETARFPVVTADERREARRRQGIDAEALVVGSIGRLAPLKNLGLLLESFSMLRGDRRLRLLLVGDGAERAQLEREAQSLGIGDRTTFAGQVERPLDYYRCMDVFAMSSVTEQRSLSLLEAMSCGLPAVVTDVGDLRVMLSPASRELAVASGDAAGLAARLSGLLEDAGRRRELGAANAAFCRQHFDAASTVRGYRELYHDALRA